MRKLLIGAVCALSLVAASPAFSAAYGGDGSIWSGPPADPDEDRPGHAYIAPTGPFAPWRAPAVQEAPVETAFWLEVCIGIILGLMCDIIWAPDDDDPDQHRMMTPAPEPEDSDDDRPRGNGGGDGPRRR